MSLDTPPEVVKGASHIIDGAGEFVIGVFIAGVQTDGGYHQHP